jgi:hypothetical protein
MIAVMFLFLAEEKSPPSNSFTHKSTEMRNIWRCFNEASVSVLDLTRGMILYFMVVSLSA